MCHTERQRSGVPFSKASLHEGVGSPGMEPSRQTASPETGWACYSERMEKGIALDTGGSILHSLVGNSLTMSPRPPGPPMGYGVETQVLPDFLAFLVVMLFGDGLTKEVL